MNNRGRHTDTHINPGNHGFQRARRGDCSGKSYAAEMLCYYSYGCDSRTPFENLAIAGDPSSEERLNTHNVIRLDVMGLLHRGEDVAAAAAGIIARELRVESPTW